MNNNIKHQKPVFKKSRIAIFFAIALLFPTLAIADLSNGLVAYYPFNGNAKDESLNGNDGTVYGASLVEDRFGNQNSAYYFDGASFIELNLNTLPSGSHERTISVWAKLDTGTSIGAIISYGMPEEWKTFAILYGTSSWGGYAAPWLGLMGFDTGSGADWFISNTPLIANKWSMTTYVYKNSRLNIYLNGLNIGTHLFPQSHNTGMSKGFIGKSIHTGFEFYMRGSLDNVRIYNRALSASEIQQLYQEIPNTPQLVSLGDINNDNSPEIAVITYNPTLKKSTATVKNAQTGALVKQIPFNGQFVPTKANVLPDLNGNGASEIAVLGVRSSDQAVQVEVRDSLSGVQLSVMPFDPAFKPLDLGVVRDINGKGTAGLAVLQQNATQLRVQLKNALTGAQIRNISFNANYKGIDLLVISDLNANQSREIAVLADNKTTSAADIVEIHDSKTGALIRTISYGTGQELKQLINLPDLNNNGGVELAVLRANTARVSLKDALSGLPVNTLDYALSQPFKLASVADSNSQIHLAMLGLRASDGQIRAEIHDALSDTLINKVVFDNYGTTVGFISIPDINGNGVAELVRLREQPGPQKLFAEVRDGRTGVLIQGMYF